MTGPCKFGHPLNDGRLDAVGVTLPFVTVIVTSYNYERYITDCLESISGQSYRNFTCVVVDDCSTDGSVGAVERYAASEAAGGRFQLVRTARNGGQMAAFKEGLRHARGSFVVLVDADDMLLPDFLETHVQAHLSRHTVAFTSSNQYQIDAVGEVVGGNHHDLQCQGEFRHVYQRTIYEPFWIWATTSSMMFRRSILDIIIPANVQDFRICADNYVVHFANLLGGSLLIPSIHGCYRRHGANGFGANPVIGGHLPVGDMSKHPAHETVRRTILLHLLDSRDALLPIFTNGGFMNLVQRVALPHEYPELKDRCPQAFPEPARRYRLRHHKFVWMRRYWGIKGKIVRRFFS